MTGPGNDSAQDREVRGRKARLREEMKQRLDDLDPVEAARSAARMRARVLELPEIGRARGILCCLSFGGEIDTWELVEELIARGKRLLVPRVSGDHLTVHEYPCALETLSFGLRQPPRSAPAAEGPIDLALLLGLAFDLRGFRLGYGRGYFDRFLEGRGLPALGLGHDFQLVDRVPTQVHDLPMNIVVTASETLRP